MIFADISGGENYSEVYDAPFKPIRNVRVVSRAQVNDNLGMLSLKLRDNVCNGKHDVRFASSDGDATERAVLAFLKVP